MKMRKSWFYIITILVLASSLLGSGNGLANSTPVEHPIFIHLKAATFDPVLGEPDLPPGLTVAGYAAGTRGYYLVQFNGPVQREWKAALEAAGAQILDYIPDFAFKVRMNPAQAARAAELSFVRWVGIFQPAYKLSPALKLEGENLYRVLVARGADYGQARAAIARSGAEVISHSDGILLVYANSTQVQEIANVLDVAWVENYMMVEMHNEYGAGVIMGANVAHASGYDGSTQIVAIADTGLGSGTASTAHADLPSSRIKKIYNWPGASVKRQYTVIDDGAVDVDSGHGTHTALSIVSDGDPAGIGKGTAPAARLVFQAVENYVDFQFPYSLTYPDGYYAVGIPSDLRQLFQQAYGEGARVHSNSWGANAAGDYTVDSANTDSFIWSNKDMLITFSAGNAGVDGNSDGLVDSDSMAAPATAKNVLTVGASENDRQGNYPCDTSLGYTETGFSSCAAMGGQNQLITYGEIWSSEFPVNPLKEDKSAGNAEQMAAFSSRGPTDDGRIKPDVVAPGTYVLSGYSDLYQQYYDSATNPRNNAWQYDGWLYPMNNQYKYLGGTSMSNPLVAGAAAVVRDYYEKGKEHSASAALVKATLINSAVDLKDENNDGVDDNAFPIPNVHEGWGRVDLASATGKVRTYIDQETSLTTNGIAAYSFDITEAGSLFKVSLVWSDYPSTESASVNLVNDLDLVITAPDGAQYLGNVFSGGWSHTGGSADRRNNVENVYIESAAAGIWTVQVKGYNVPNGPQPFALVLDGMGALTQPENQAPIASFTYSCTGLSCSFNGNGSSDADGSIVAYAWKFGDETTDSGPTTSHTYGTEGTYTVELIVTDDDDATDSEVKEITVSTPTTTEIHVGDLDGVSKTVRNNWNATVTITVHDAGHNTVSGITVSGNWSGGYTGTGSCTTNTAGECSVLSGNMNSKKTSVTFTVSNLVGTDYTYNSIANHDPDGDSTGTVITVNKP
jgi:serine protease AprX